MDKSDLNILVKKIASEGIQIINKDFLKDISLLILNLFI